MAVKKSELYSLLWEACNKLRGGVEPSRYRDYVLVLLFFKYVSDRYKGRRFAEFRVNPGASFDDLILAKGKSDVGERVDKIIQKFLEDNRLQGSLPDVRFNNPDELGSGKELVDKVSGLIAVFQNPAIDSAIAQLPAAQARRVYAHYICGTSKADITRDEGVEPSVVCRSIERGLEYLKNLLEKSL